MPIVQADFSQLEVRILGCLSGEPKFKHAFENDYDFHTYTASQIYECPMEAIEKDSEERSSSKRVNFGIIFGIGDKKLATQINSTREVAARLLGDWYRKYPRAKAWIDKTRAQSTRRLRVRSFVGQVRRLPEARNPDKYVMWRAQRQGTNFLIAAFGSAMTWFAMIHVRAEFLRRGMRALIVGQVHDSIIVDCPTSEVQDVGRILHDVMTMRTQRQFPALTIPLKADVSCGPSYGEQDLTILPSGEITK